MNSESFLSISREVLAKIVERDALTGAPEIDIFNGCLKWAAKECERNGWEASPANKREALGNVLHLIRFPLMPLEIFSNFVTTTGLLNKDESLSVFLYLTRKRVNRNDSEHPRFPVKKRAAAPQQKNIISNGWFGPPSQFFTECILCSYLYETDKERCPNCGAINEWTTLIFSSESILVDINLNIESTL